MALDDLIRSAVATADRATASLQPSVQHYTWTGQQTGTGQRLYPDPPVSRPAIVEASERFVQNAQGQMVRARHTVTFLQPVVVRTTDKIVLPDGTTGSILEVQGVVDPNTNAPYASTVLLG